MKLTDERFCEIETQITGEPIDKVEQLKHVSFSGRELKDYLEKSITILNGSNIFFFDCWDNSGKLQTKEIKALNSVNAEIIFKSMFPDLGYDKPYK